MDIKSTAKIANTSRKKIKRITKKAFRETTNPVTLARIEKLLQKIATSDDLNPEFIFNNTHTALLVMAVQGKIDLEYLAHKQLANRGLNASGEWVGFEQAKLYLTQKYN